MTGTSIQPAFIAFGIAAAMALLLAAFARRTFFAGKPFFMLTLAATACWIAMAGLELNATTPEAKVRWAIAAWPAIALVPVTWAAFLSDFCNARRTDRTALRWLPVLGVPAAIGAAAMTNGLHQLFYGAATGPVALPGSDAIDYAHGPLFYLSAGTLYVFLVQSFWILGKAAVRAKAPYRAFLRAMLPVMLVPIAGNVAYIGFGVTVFGFDPTPFLFAFAFLPLGGVLLLSRALDLDGVARDVLFARSRDALLVYDRTGRLAGANDAARAVLRDTLPGLGQPLPTDGPVWRFAQDTLQPGPQPEPRIAWIGERAFDMQIVGIEPPLSRGGPPAGWILSLRDNTHLVRMSDELLAERDRLIRVMENSGIGFMMIGETGKILYANSETARITGRRQQDIEVLNFDDPTWQATTLNGTPMAAVDLPVAKVIQTGRPVLGARHAMVRRDGERCVISVNAMPLPGPAGMQIVCSMTDVTREERDAEALREQIDAAQAANRAKSDFLAVMSHEIRTPLNAVLGMAELLADGNLGTEERRRAEVIRDAGRGLLSMLNDVLDAARLDEGRLTLTPAPFRPAALAEEIDALFGPQIEARGLGWEIFVSGAADAERMGDAGRLAQILRNLVGNAAKFTERGRILVTISDRSGEPLVMSVRDTGLGMDDATIARTIEPFWQGESGKTRRHGGAGLGLAIVSGLVRRMDGVLDIESTPGLGTAIRVTVPLPEAPPADVSPVRGREP